jgi:hypothetical protein
MTTRKDVLTNKYEILKSKLELYVNKDLFPSNDFDIVDIISFIKLYFPIGTDYNETIRGLMKEKEIIVSDNDFWIISSLIIAFIENINNI